MTPTPEQQAVCDAITNTSDNLIVDACAGGAKTTTLIMASHVLPKGRLILCFAFNKDIATTLQARMPYWVTSSTWHSFGLDALDRHLGGKPRVDGRKTAHILKEMIPDFKQRREIEDDVVALVSRAKAFGYGCGCAASDDLLLEDLADRFALDCESDLVINILEQSRRDLKVVDFDDMLWLTLLLRCDLGVPGFVLLDEAQDTNVVQRALLRRMIGVRTEQDLNGSTVIHNSGRLLAVGDPHQSIYGFRGADADAMNALATEFNCTRMALSVSWRCSRAVVTEAQKHL